MAPLIPVVDSVNGVPENQGSLISTDFTFGSHSSPQLLESCRPAGCMRTSAILRDGVESAEARPQDSIVASQGDPVQEAIRDGVEGLLLPMDDPELLSHRILAC